MNKAYDITQGLLSWIGFLALGVAFPFTLEALGAINALGYNQYVAETALIFSLVGISAVSVKLVMGWASNKFWIKIRIADKLHAIAYRIDPRRK